MNKERIPGTNLEIDKDQLFDAIGITETPTEKMDRIVKANSQFEMVNSLLTVLAKEVGLPANAHAKDIFVECGKVFHNYNMAMEEFRQMRAAGASINAEHLQPKPRKK